MIACVNQPLILSPRRRVKTAASKKPVDLYRETPLRYLGYANEVGESFAAFLPNWGVPASYAVAATYVMMDTIDKTKKKYDETNDLDEAGKVAIDTCTWQMLASVFWPGSFIRLVVAASTPHQFQGFVFKELDYVPTIIGLLTIPLIVKPIDEAVDRIMKNSVSKILYDDPHDDMMRPVSIIGAAIMVPPVLYACADMIHK
jgi:fission process protein 1